MVDLGGFDLGWARRAAVGGALFGLGGLGAAMERMGFVQADPIRSPARAQDLILRHRVEGYRAGDLERGYAGLEVEEGVLYAYGFMARSLGRAVRSAMGGVESVLEERVLGAVAEMGEAHPRELERRLGAERVVNAWGGMSKATTRALERLHLGGRLRVTRRDNGVRVYALADTDWEPRPGRERLEDLIRAHARIFAPAPRKSLQKELARYRALGDARLAMDGMVAAGELRQAEIDGVAYVWPSGLELGEAEGGERVRLLAPFDPLVWDRFRFERLWGWVYRFEAYTPPAKRVRGYYAMPLLWGCDVVGWANARVEKGRALVDVGFAKARPRGKAFSRELEAEVARLEGFLGLGEGEG